MSDEYISQETAIKSTWMILEGMGYPRSENRSLERTVEAVFKSAPAADVVEVVHGRWIKDDVTGEPICSVCYSGKPTRAVCSSVIEHKLNNHEIRYCYYCGAKMDGGQDDAPTSPYDLLYEEGGANTT